MKVSLETDKFKVVIRKVMNENNIYIYNYTRSWIITLKMSKLIETKGRQQGHGGFNAVNWKLKSLKIRDETRNLLLASGKHFLL